MNSWLVVTNLDEFRGRVLKVLKRRLALEDQVARMTPDAILLQQIGDWATVLPERAWTPGLPPHNAPLGLVAVRTSTGKILTGRVDAFLGLMLYQIERHSEYGVVIAWVKWQVPRKQVFRRLTNE